MANIQRRLLLAAFGLFVAALALQADGMPTEPGFPVKKIPFADRISDWRAVDKRHLVVSTSPRTSYLLTLRRDCHTLNFASRLGVSSSNNTVYAGFDYVTSDGQRCAIQRINELTKAEKKALTGA